MVVYCWTATLCTPCIFFFLVRGRSDGTGPLRAYRFVLSVRRRRLRIAYFVSRQRTGCRADGRAEIRLDARIDTDHVPLTSKKKFSM